MGCDIWGGTMKHKTICAAVIGLMSSGWSGANAAGVCVSANGPGPTLYQTNYFYQVSAPVAGTLSGTTYYVSWNWANYTPFTSTLQLKICVATNCHTISGSQAPGSDSTSWSGIKGNPAITYFVQDASNPTRTLHPVLNASGMFNINVCSQ
jgi:hypothetical protein